MTTLKIHGKDTEIDEDFATLVQELDRVGLRTISCCAGHPDDARKHKRCVQLCFDASDVTVLLDKGRVSINWQR